MIKGDHDYLTGLAKNNLCSEHKSPLEVAWYGQEHTWVLRCGEDHYPDTLVKSMSLTEEYRAGMEFPEPIQSNIQKSIAKTQQRQGKQPTAITFSGVPATDLGTGELLVPELIKGLVEYAERYKLDPARGHVVMMYGKPYIGLDGYLYHAFRERILFSINSQPMTTEEAKAYKIGKTDHGWISKVTLLDTSQEFTGTGIVTYEEMTEKSPRNPTRLRSPVVAAKPWQMAQKRAEWQALRRAFPIGETEE